MLYAGVIVSASVNMLEYAEVRLMDISTLEGQVKALVEKTLKGTNYTCSPLADFEEQEWLLALSACICLSPQPSVIPIWQHDVILYSLCGASPYVTEKTWRTGCGILRWCLIRVRYAQWHHVAAFRAKKNILVISVKNPETGQYKPPIFQVVNKLNTSTATISCFVLDS